MSTEFIKWPSNTSLAITDLTDVLITNLQIGDSLVWNGTDFVNKNVNTISAGPGQQFYLVDDNLVAGPTAATSVQNLSHSPNVTDHDHDTTAVPIWSSNAPLLIGNYSFATPLTISEIQAGQWQFAIWASYDHNISGNSSILMNITRIVTGTGTITITGSGATRTATVSGSTPFQNTAGNNKLNTGDASSNASLSSYIQVPGGIFPITAYTSASVVTITVPTAYVNDTAAAFDIWYPLFELTSGSLVSPNPTLYTVTSTQPGFAVNASDTIGLQTFGSSTASFSGAASTPGYYHSNNSTNTQFTSPIAILHDDLSGLQGGASGQYYHLTAAQYAAVTYQGNTFNGLTQLVQTDSSGRLPAIDGSQLTHLPAGGQSFPPSNDLSMGGYSFTNLSSLSFTNALGVVMNASNKGVTIGKSATINSNTNGEVAIGDGSSCGSYSVAIGHSTTSGTTSAIVGWGCTASDYCVGLGNQISVPYASAFVGQGITSYSSGNIYSSAVGGSISIFAAAATCVGFRATAFKANTIALGYSAGYHSAYDATLPSVFIDSIDRGTAAGEKTTGLMYGNVDATYARGTPATQQLTINAPLTVAETVTILAHTLPSSPVAGMIAFDGTHFQGYNGTAWKQLDN